MVPSCDRQILSEKDDVTYLDIVVDVLFGVRGFVDLVPDLVSSL